MEDSKISVQTSEKKVVSRTVAIGLGIVCIILLVGLVGAFLVHSSMIDNKNNKISDLNQQLTSLSLQVADLTSITNLTKSTVWLNFKNASIQAGYENVWNFISTHAGYISVQIFSLTADNIYVRVNYDSHGVNYDNQINVGMGGTAVFPVLPASIQISVGNPGMTSATTTVTIIYYY
jgi:cell division protein FtsL